MSFTTVTVTGKYLTPAGAAEVGTVSFTLSAPIMDAVGKVIRSTATATATLDGTGAFSLALPANDDTGTVPTGTTYGVVEQLSKNSIRAYSVVIPHAAAAGTVDITALAPVANSVITYGVTSVNGQTGAVTVSGSGATDATTTAKGIVKLAGDLAGTADLPTVPGLAAKADSSATTAALAGKQPLDSDLTAIAALDASTAGAIASDGAGWVKKTYAQLKAALGITTGDVSGLGTAATVNTGTTSGTIPLLSTGGVLPIARLATGTPDGTKFVRDDGTLQNAASLPSQTGNNGKFLTTDGSNPSWATVTGGSGGADSVTTVAASGAAQTLTLGTGQLGTWDLTLTAACALTFAGATAGTAARWRLIARQDATGSRLITWPAAVKWRNNVVPTLSTSASAVDIFEFVSVDGGTTVYGFRIDAAGIPTSILAAKGDIIAATAAAAATNLAVGSNGQVLTADSTQAPGIKWATPSSGSGGAPPMLNSSWYYSFFTTTSSIGVSSTNGYTMCVPIWIGTGTVTQLGIAVQNIGSGFTASARLGLWDGSTGVPGALLVDAGLVSVTAATGNVSAACSLAVTNGLYWISVSTQSVSGSGTMPNLQGYAGSHKEISAGTSPNMSQKGFLHAVITGALPGTFPYTQGDFGTSGPVVGVRM